ncbi:carbohydrate ABC transporter permease [Paenibacillus koleovorans]|uniref:carbohydrate ABC transporter permease n=1 Tax=Paenibacillus koleovorans TaxID=121608 RepID=UPI000FD85D43|nr:carbohydrate ABC transporter permease [Paenibacillus koleovorans]
MPSYKSDRMFHIFNNTLLLLLSVTMVLPMLHLAAVSLSSSVYAEAKLVYLWPKGFHLGVYNSLFGMETLWRAMGVSVYITVVGTLICLALTSTLAYALSRPQMRGRGWVLKGIIVTFIFHASLIPNFLVVKAVGLDNTLWALMIPGALGAFNVILMKTFFQNLSQELYDAAKIDGCSEYGNFARMALPLSLPVVATVALFHAVAMWNSYFSALIFIRKKNLMPIQVVLRNTVMNDQLSSLAGASTLESISVTPEMMKAGIVLFATLPILIVYPFIQKYFVKGAMLGSLKE